MKNENNFSYYLPKESKYKTAIVVLFIATIAAMLIDSVMSAIGGFSATVAAGGNYGAVFFWEILSGIYSVAIELFFLILILKDKIRTFFKVQLVINILGIIIIGLFLLAMAAATIFKDLSILNFLYTVASKEGFYKFVVVTILYLIILIGTSLLLKGKDKKVLLAGFVFQIAYSIISHTIFIIKDFTISKLITFVPFVIIAYLLLVLALEKKEEFPKEQVISTAAPFSDNTPVE